MHVDEIKTSTTMVLLPPRLSPQPGDIGDLTPRPWEESAVTLHLGCRPRAAGAPRPGKGAFSFRESTCRTCFPRPLGQTRKLVFTTRRPFHGRRRRPALQLHSGCPAAWNMPPPPPASLRLTILQLAPQYPPHLRNCPWLSSALGSSPPPRPPWPARTSRKLSFLWQESVAVPAQLPPRLSARERGVPLGMHWKPRHIC